MTRISALREALKWPQARLAEYIGRDQSRVSRMENGAIEDGAVKRLLDNLAREIGRPDLIAENFNTPSEAAE